MNSPFVFGEGMHQLSMDEYLSLNCCSSSGLRALWTHSPWHAAHLAINHDTPAKSAGSLVHLLTLEPERFSEVYQEFEGTRRSNAKKQEWAEIIASGKIPVRTNDLDEAQIIAEAARERFAERIDWEPRYVEQTLIWKEGEIWCKARPDLMVLADHLDGSPGAIFDLKRMADASRDAFARSIFNLGFHLQAAWYLRGARALGFDIQSFFWLVIEAETGAGVEYEIDAPTLAHAKSVIDDALGVWSWCHEHNDWPGYSGGPIGLPPWALRVEEELE